MDKLVFNLKRRRMYNEFMISFPGKRMNSDTKMEEKIITMIGNYAGMYHYVSTSKMSNLYFYLYNCILFFHIK